MTEPPRLYPIVRTPCSHGCDGSTHPGYVCETWTPFDSNGQPRGKFDVCQAATLPRRRSQSLTDRFRDKSRGHYPDDSWVLALAYVMLLDQEPELAPDPHRLRAAVEADDLPGVDTLMQPLDFAAARLLDVPAEQWWETSFPRLHDWATATNSAADPSADGPSDMTRIEYDSRRLWLAERLLQSRVKRPNYKGYMEPEHVNWRQSAPFLTELLVQQLGGYQRGTEVQLRDGRRVTIRGVHWGETGRPPVAYDVREVGAPPFPLDNIRVADEEIQPARAEDQ